MFDNAGRKIQVLAKISFWITFISGIIMGIALRKYIDNIALLIIPISFFSGWLENI